jgi:hypothetical protein
MRRILVIVPLAALLWALESRNRPARAAALSTPPPWCLSTTDAHAAAILKVLRQLGTSTDSNWVKRREALELPTTPAADIVMLSDEVLCERASRAVDSQAITGPPLNAAVYLARFGTHYAVNAPNLRGGEWGSIDFFDSTLTFKAGLAW